MKNNFKKYRTTRGISQKDFAVILNVKQSQLSKIENNDIKQFPLFILDNLFKYDPEVDLNYLFGYRKNEDASDSKSLELVVNQKDEVIDSLKKDKKILSDSLESLNNMWDIIKNERKT